MSNKYRHYKNITREMLDEVKDGDLITVNNWATPMTVMAVSKNYFVMTCEENGERYYSVCSKLPWDGVRHNNMVGGMFHCGPDDRTFGSELWFEDPDIYSFKNPETAAKYLQKFENGEYHISERQGIAIYDLIIESRTRYYSGDEILEKAKGTDAYFRVKGILNSLTPADVEPPQSHGGWD